MSEPLAQRLRRHVEVLAGDIGERHVWRPRALGRAADYVRACWEASGHAVDSQRFDSQGVEVENLVVQIGDAERVVLVGAHYDTVRGSPGADDNGSGVAALIELGRLLGASSGVRLVAFVNEEKPFDEWREAGSLRYAQAARARREAITMMLSLEMLGCYSDVPGSQRYPAGVRWFYPDRGDFIAFVANLRSQAALRRAVAAFRRSTDFPCRQLAAPQRLVPAIARSDHRWFWENGFAALMVTDTAFNRYPHYHQPTDTPEKLDYERMARVVEGLAGALPMLARR